MRRLPFTLCLAFCLAGQIQAGEADRPAIPSEAAGLVRAPVSTAPPVPPAVADLDFRKAVRQLSEEREAFQRSYDWGPREEYPARMKEFGRCMQEFHLQELRLRKDMLLRHGEIEAAVELETHINRLSDPRRKPELDLPREDARRQKIGTPVTPAAPEGGAQ